MLPIMKVAQDGKEHTARELRQVIADQLGLSENERKQLLPSGSQPIFTNRMAWARAHLQRAGLVEKTGRGSFRVTPRGLDALTANPPAINIKFLQQYPDYAEARNKTKEGAPTESSSGERRRLRNGSN